MISAIQNGIQGMGRASKVVNAASADIARGVTPAPNGAPSGDIARAMVNLTVGHRTYDANAKVVEVAARMLDKMA